MIILELHQPDELPEVREASAEHVLRLSVVIAHRNRAPIPNCIKDAVAYLIKFSRRLWAFFGLDDAKTWAESYEGEQADAVRFVVWHTLSDKHLPPPEYLYPAIYEWEPPSEGDL